MSFGRKNKNKEKKRGKSEREKSNDKGITER
jgi:hypothetical protein